jgi:hypothetical protein
VIKSTRTKQTKRPLKRKETAKELPKFEPKEKVVKIAAAVNDNDFSDSDGVSIKGVYHDLREIKRQVKDL